MTPTVAARVLVVEDDAGIADAVVYALDRDGMRGLHAGSLAEARVVAAGGFDAAVLDLGLPDGSGYTLLDEWRRAGGAAPVIVLTSREGDVDCVASLEAGADDFVGKPFSPRALVARVRAVLRRAAPTPALAPAPAPGLRIDLDRRTATFSGRPLPLTRIELDLLATLAAARGRVLARRQLIERVWGDGWALDDRTVDSHVKALRRKLRDAGAAESLLVAVRGVGFKLQEGPPPP